ncbi:ribose 5-phosphate isomerase B [Candidatus Woesearchaeota archaeon]|nr:ribose 5-phosphate isomerase B [Candidatus Woesearchaeota archaeon]
MLFIGSDHGGYKLKEEICNYLDEKKIKYNDLGTYSEESCDYPDIAKKVCEDVVKNNGQGILVCGTGIGMSMSANKYKGIKAALCWNEFTAEMSRKHNNANVLCLGGRVLEKEMALKIVEIFLNTGFEAGRHERRIAKVMEIENC